MRRRPRPVAVAALLASLGLATAALADGPTDTVASATPPPAPPSSSGSAATPDALTASPSLTTSLGGPSSGHLRGAVPLPLTAAGFVSNTARPNAEAFFGTVETIRALLRAAAVVDRDLPGSALVVNDVGFREGGPITHHGSHQAGRDVDVLFYLLARDGTPLRSKGIPLDERGRGWDFADLSVSTDDVPVRLDVRRTWRFVQALLEDHDGAGSPVHRIFVAEHLRTRLLEQAERARAPQAIRDRFAEVTCQPSYPHDDHLHVRFFCSPEDLQAGCEDSAPMYAWRRRELGEHGATPVIARGRDRERAPRTTPPAQPRVDAPPMHSRVRAFLERREAWARQPHPGRPYCR